MQVENITQIFYNHNTSVCVVLFAVYVSLDDERGNTKSYRPGNSLGTSHKNGKFIEAVLDTHRTAYMTQDINY